ncbi:MAG TPA: hypothetical protein VM285_17305 [Polyangia bacterium]|nr:hypothetical protein [Polyangia bacterium]
MAFNAGSGSTALSALGPVSNILSLLRPAEPAEFNLPGGNTTRDLSPLDLNQIESFSLAAQLGRTRPEFAGLTPGQIISIVSPPDPRPLGSLFAGSGPGVVQALEQLGYSLNPRSPNFVPGIRADTLLTAAQLAEVAATARGLGETNLSTVVNLGRRPEIVSALQAALSGRAAPTTPTSPATAAPAVTARTLGGSALRLLGNVFGSFSTPQGATRLIGNVASVTQRLISPPEAPSMAFIPASLSFAPNGGSGVGGIVGDFLSGGDGIFDRVLSAAPSIIAAFRGGGNGGSMANVSANNPFLPSIPFMDAVPNNTPGASMGALACITPRAGGGLRLPSRVDVPSPSGNGFVTFKNMGRPVLWTGDFAAAKRVRKVAGRARRRVGGR